MRKPTGEKRMNVYICEHGTYNTVCEKCDNNNNKKYEKSQFSNFTNTILFPHEVLIEYIVKINNNFL